MNAWLWLMLAGVAVSMNLTFLGPITISKQKNQFLVNI